MGDGKKYIIMLMEQTSGMGGVLGRSEEGVSYGKKRL